MQKTKELATETSCMNSALHDEYVFVLLARDAASPVAIDAWCDERIRTGKNIESDQLINEARGCAAAMRVTRQDVRVRLGKADPGQAGKAQQREAEVDRNGFVVSARFKCRTCGCAAIVDGVTCSSCVERAKPSQRVAFVKDSGETVHVDPPRDREIALIGHNLAELPHLSPEARRRVAVYVKRFVEDTEPNRGALVPDPANIVEAYARCGASLRGLDRNQAKRVLLAVAAMLDVDLTTRA